MIIDKETNLRSTVLSVMALLMCLACLRSAPAQSMSMSVGRPQDAFSPAISVADINVIARVLTLGEAEREALRALYEGHASAMKVRRDVVEEELQDLIELAQVAEDWTKAQPGASKEDGWTSEAAKLRDGFLADLKSLLTKEQTDRWPLVERELRRFNQIAGGRFGGESIDLIRMVEDLAPATWQDPAAAELLTQYATRIDALLKTREEATSGEQSQSFHAMVRTDKAAAERIWAGARSARIAVRDLNLSTMERLAAMLPEDKATALRRKFLERAYPALLKPTRTERFVRAANTLETLDKGQRAAVDSIVAEYDRRLWELLKEMASIRRDQEAVSQSAELKEGAPQVAVTADGEEIRFMSASDVKADPDNPLVKAKLRRVELDRDTKSKLVSVLSDAQAQACRQPPVEQLFFGDDTHWGL
jgi:hypothetical protein